jgi:hypothetical protein
LIREHIIGGKSIKAVIVVVAPANNLWPSVISSGLNDIHFIIGFIAVLTTV